MQRWMQAAESILLLALALVRSSLDTACRIQCLVAHALGKISTNIEKPVTCMNSACLTDFYRGWMIEVVPQGIGYTSVCYSPSRQRIDDDVVYSRDFLALNAGKALVDLYLACQQFSGVLRELYESEKLEYEEWRSLSQSITDTIGVSR